MMGRASFSAACSGLFCALLAGCPQPQQPCEAFPTSSVHTDPAAPLSRFDGPNFVEILEVRALDDGQVMYCSGVQGLVVANAANPENPQVVANKLTGEGGSVSFPRCQHLAFNNDMVFTTSRGDEVQPVSFIAGFQRTVAAPIRRFTHQDTERSFEGILAHDNVLYAATHQDGLVVYDIAEDGLTEVNEILGFENAWAVSRYADTLVVLDGRGGVKLLDITDPRAPLMRGELELSGSAQWAAVDQARGIAFVAAGSAGLYAVDVTDIDAPALLGQLNTRGSVLQVGLDDEENARRAYLADWGDAKVVDIDDPTNMVLRAVERPATGKSFSRVLGVDGRGDDIFVGEWHGLYAVRFNDAATAPDLTFRGEALEFGQLEAGEQDAVAVIVENTGDETLTIRDVQFRAEDSAFVVDDTGGEIAPGEAKVFEVLFTAPSNEEVRDTIFFCSDDPDEPVRSLALIANTVKNGVGDVSDEIEVEFLSGERWSLSEHDGPVLLAYFATF